MQYPYAWEQPIFLNPSLIETQGIDFSTIEKLEKTHIERNRIFKEMHETDPSNTARLLILAREFDGLEYYQQALWKFTLDPLFHNWFAVPHCSCNKTFANDYYGLDSIRIIHCHCPVHWQLIDGCVSLVGGQTIIKKSKDIRNWNSLLFLTT